MKKVKILLVDDSQIMLRHIGDLLGKQGWEVHAKTNLPTALDAFTRYSPDAILSDFILEGGSTGLTVIAAIFATSKDKKVPAAIMTMGALSAADEQKAKNQNIRVIQKPVRGKEDEFTQNVSFWLKDVKVLG